MRSHRPSSSRQTTSGGLLSTPLRTKKIASHMSNNEQHTSRLEKNILYLEQNHVKFNAPSKSESVFFDECNREIITVTNGFIESPDDSKPKTKVVVQSTDTDGSDKIEFLLPVEKRLLSIKFNPIRTVLAYHAERNIIEFMNVRENLDSGDQQRHSLDLKRYVQASRARNSKLIGFLWTGALELAIITDLSVEYYHVDPTRFRLKHVKLFQSSTNWFVYQRSVVCHKDVTSNPAEDQFSILMVSTGSLGNTMQPYMFTDGQIIKLQRFDVEGTWHDNEKLELFERSVTMAQIYGSVRLLVLQHGSLNVKTKGAQIIVYTVDPNSGATFKTHTLDLDVGGRFAINILDNLIIAHNQPSKTSLIFDIMIESTEKSDCPHHYVSLLDSQPVRQLKMKCGDGTERDVEMYSLNWVFFQTNFIIDAKLGLLSTLHIDLSAIQNSITENIPLLNFLAHRRNSEDIILRKCEQIVSDSYEKAVEQSHMVHFNPLAEVSSAFDIISNLVVSAPELNLRKDSSVDGVKKFGLTSKSQKRQSLAQKNDHFGTTLLQEDIQRTILKSLEDQLSESDRLAGLHFVSSALLEFIFVLGRQEKNVEFCIYDQLLRCLIQGKQYFQIVQMIRSKIFKDSKQLACMLLAMRNQYWPAAQMGLDMFDRLDCQLTGLMEALDLDLSSSTRTSSNQFEHSSEVEIN